MTPLPSPTEIAAIRPLTMKEWMLISRCAHIQKRELTEVEAAWRRMEARRLQKEQETEG